MRAIGQGPNSAKTFCGLMNLPSPHTKVKKHEEILGMAAEKVSKSSMEQAAQEAVVENEGEANISVALDGTWQKRGFSSLNGVVSATSVDTGKVIDISVLSKYCRCPEKLNGKHETSCTANFQGSSGNMEVEGAKQIFAGSLEKYGVRYTKYLGDGDSKAYNEVVKSQPYGTDCQVQKLECIGHVQKRMGSRLRQLKVNLLSTFSS